MPAKKQISSIIIEDEPLAASLLNRYATRFSGLCNQAVFTNAIAAEDYLVENKVDLLFLDIHLPKLKGLEFLDRLKREYAVILTTAYSQYALDGFNKGVVDYLLKPIEYPRFEQAVQRAMKFIGTATSKQSTYLQVAVNKSILKLALDDIFYVKSDKGYLVLHLASGNLIRTKSSISKFLARAGADFVQIHKSYIVNRKKIREHSGSSLTMMDGGVLSIGRKFRAEVRQYFRRLH